VNNGEKEIFKIIKFKPSPSGSFIQGQPRQNVCESPSRPIAHACDPKLHRELRPGGSRFQVSQGWKSFSRPHLNGKRWARWHVPVIPPISGSIKQKNDSPGKKRHPTSTITRTNTVVECMSSKLKALSSN
jgi:hypothetical protein